MYCNPTAQGRPKGRLFLYRESGWDIIREKRVEGFYENRKQRDAAWEKYYENINGSKKTNRGLF